MLDQSACGGIFHIKTEVTGQISFWHPEGYSNNKNCEWYMEIPKDSLFSITYNDFNLESANESVCSTDYLLIRNDNKDAHGDLTTLPIVAKQCGAMLPSNLLLKGNRVLIVFHSNQENQYRGFRMTYRIIKERFPNSYIFLGLNCRILGAAFSD